jgi:hypothetical protein
MDDADAARLRHRDGQTRFGHGVHRRGEDRHVEANRARQPRANVRLAWHDRAMAGSQQHVVERKTLRKR